VLDRLLGRGARVVARRRTPGGWSVVELDTFLHRAGVDPGTGPASPLRWESADPHHATGNSLNCPACRCAVEGRFDPSDPAGTLGA
jgi:hypothetical protein